VGDWVVDHALTEGHSGRSNTTAPASAADDGGQPPSLGQAMHDLLSGEAGGAPVLGTAASILA
jgi:hypothetical protein